MEYEKLCSLFLIAVIRTALACPTGFVANGASCYHFSHDTESWVNAMDACRSLDSQLVEINDEIENKFLTAGAKQFKTAFWIALSDIREEDTWNWMNSHDEHHLKSTDFSDWHPGQPNNFQNDENCAMINDNGHGTWQWYDYSCHNNVHYICETSDDSIEVIG